MGRRKKYALAPPSSGGPVIPVEMTELVRNEQAAGQPLPPLVQLAAAGPAVELSEVDPATAAPTYAELLAQVHRLKRLVASLRAKHDSEVANRERVDSY